MLKAMCNSGIVLGLLVAAVFLLDVTPFKIPFGRPSVMMDIGFILSGLLVAYLGWHARKEQG